MKFESKFDIDDVVYVKTSKGVYMAKVCCIQLDTSQGKQKNNDFRFIYTLWASDRRDWAGHTETAYECNMARTFEEAYYDADTVFPWNILEDIPKGKLKEYAKNNG